MKNKFVATAILFFVCLPLMISLAQSSDQKAAKSVVKITTSYMGKDDKGKTVRIVGNGSGFCWNDKMHIVTALHVVAGIKNEDITVYTDRETRSSGAKVISVFKEADLALLELDTDLGLSPLEIEIVDHNSPEEYYIWGFPHGIFQMGGDHIRFSRSIDPPPTLNSLVNKTDFKFTLETQGYPLPKAQILRVSSTIQPGHSGAPIITRNGTVIGVADGGLRSGTARLNWAFPAHLYVPMLLTSKDPVPSAKSLQANLYASSTIVPDDADEVTQNRILAEEARSNVVAGGNQEISKIWTLSYDEILETMDEEDQYELNEIAWEFEINMNSTS
jgi:S1-C subfamily serine protease